MEVKRIPKVGHGPKTGPNEFDCVFFFTCIPLVFHGPYIKPVGHGSIGLLQALFIRFFLDSLAENVCLYVGMLSGWVSWVANFNLLPVGLSRLMCFLWKGLDAISLF